MLHIDTTEMQSWYTLVYVGVLSVAEESYAKRISKKRTRGPPHDAEYEGASCPVEMEFLDTRKELAGLLRHDKVMPKIRIEGHLQILDEPPLISHPTL